MQQFLLFNNLQKTSADFLVETSTEVLIYIKINPNAKHNKVLTITTKNKQDYLKIQIKESPVNNLANNMLIIFLSTILDIAKSCFYIKSGAISGYKIIAVNKNLNSNLINDIKNIFNNLIDKNK